MMTDRINKLEKIAEQRKQDILLAKDALKILGTTFYVSNDGDDQNDGKTPNTPWKTILRVNQAELAPGDAVLFRRGDLFRGGAIMAKAGVTYGAYGEGDKPRLYGWDRDLANSALWTLFDKQKQIWKLNTPILDVGTLVFNDGQAWSRKLIPSYIHGRFVCRENEDIAFDLREQMTQNLDVYWHYTERMTTSPTKGENFEIPVIDDQSFGELYLRCDIGNPGEVFSHIEALPRRCMFRVGKRENVTIDNLCIRYVGHHAISAGGHVVGLHVSNCEIGWIGGTIQHYFGTDPNYVQGRRGTVTRFGNGVEIYGGCENYVVENCYIYQCYDAAITHQYTTQAPGTLMKNIRYRNNLVEKCVYSIEYFLEMQKDDLQSHMEDILIEGNVLRMSGYGWGQQRHNQDTPAHIKGWSYVNRARDFMIRNNIFDRAAYRMLHLVAYEKESVPQLSGNIYAQYRGNMLGQYGYNQEEEPPILYFDSSICETVANTLGDCEAQVVFYEQ